MKAGVLVLLPDCVLPGCRNVVTEVGQPCDECVAIFAAEPGGWRLVAVDGPALTEEQVAERDAAVAAAYIAQAEIAAAAEPGRDVERKANQLCWVCDQRRKCRRDPDWIGEVRWICRDCEELS